MRAMVVPLFTLLPPFTKIFLRVPDAGAFISVLILTALPVASTSPF